MMRNIDHFKFADNIDDTDYDDDEYPYDSLTQSFGVQRTKTDTRSLPGGRRAHRLEISACCNIHVFY